MGNGKHNTSGSPNKKAKGSLSEEKWVSLSNDTKRFYSDLSRETDRGAALVCAAFLEEALEVAIRAALMQDTEYVTDTKGRVGNRLKLARSLGLIGPNICRALEILSKIRNEFAHSHRPITFDDGDIKSRCASLQTVRVPGRVVRIEPARSVRIGYRAYNRKANRSSEQSPAPGAPPGRHLGRPVLAVEPRAGATGSVPVL